MMNPDSIKVGTSGWKFDDWAGRFYPLRVPKSRWLEYYAARFPVGELNSSYYRIPARKSFEAIARRTPDEFGLFVKVHADVTHHRTLPEVSLQQLLASAEPLQASGKLLGLLAQFPASFKRSAVNEKYLTRVRTACRTQRLCVEFRDRSWDADEVRHLLREMGASWVSPDEPPLPRLMPLDIHSTSDIVYLRFHGRNRETWYDPERGDRYDYDYSEQELDAWGERVISFTEEGVQTVFLFFNNCHLGQAIKNAEWFRQWIQRKKTSANRAKS